jgi:hypothetical protein
MTHWPHQLPTSRGNLLNAGPAPDAGGRRYLNPATGDATTVFHGRTIRTGPEFSVVALQEAPAQPLVRIDHAKISAGALSGPGVGVEIFVGYLHYGDPTVSLLGWTVPRVNVGPRPGVPGPALAGVGTRPRGVATGVIKALTAKGAIIKDDQGRDFLAHVDQMRGMTKPAKVSLRVTFIPATIAGKAAAVGVRAA